jgi:hypothetical protein
MFVIVSSGFGHSMKRKVDNFGYLLIIILEYKG